MTATKVSNADIERLLPFNQSNPIHEILRRIRPNPTQLNSVELVINQYKHCSLSIVSAQPKIRGGTD